MYRPILRQLETQLSIVTIFRHCGYLKYSFVTKPKLVSFKLYQKLEISYTFANILEITTTKLKLYKNIDRELQ